MQETLLRSCVRNVLMKKQIPQEVSAGPYPNQCGPRDAPPSTHLWTTLPAQFEDELFTSSVIHSMVNLIIVAEKSDARAVQCITEQAYKTATAKSSYP